MNYRDITDARNEALQQIQMADIATRHAAKLIVGRLKIAEVDDDTLRTLKKELQNFNARTGKWDAQNG